MVGPLPSTALSDFLQIFWGTRRFFTSMCGFENDENDVVRFATVSEKSWFFVEERNRGTNAKLL